MGRVSAIDQFGTTVLYPAGIALVGLLSTAPGPYWTELGGGLLTVAVAILALLLFLGRPVYVLPRRHGDHGA